MTRTGPDPESPQERLEEVEAALGLHREDRGEELHGLYRLNVETVPRLRVAGYQLLLAFAALHNLVLGTGPGWRAFIAVTLVVELYALGQREALQRYFTRVRRIHLGTLFLLTDLVAFTLVIWVTGAEESWLWPVYLLRVADQMWVDRRRALAMGVAGATCYVVLLALVAAGGADLALAAEGLKVAILLTLAGFMVASSGLPWEFESRTRAARDLILRLERQSLELERERARAEEASRAKSDFLAQMSHELRTPLNSVVGFSKLLLRDDTTAKLSKKERAYAERIHRNGTHLLLIISDILDISRLQEGGLQVMDSPVDVEALVREVVEDQRDRARPKVRLFVSFPAHTRPIRSDRARLRQVLANLVDNATKYTEKGWIRVDCLADADTGRPREIRVVDTGRGIDPDLAAAVFEPFRQVERGLARRHEGTGLGLTIAQALCELMGFRLSLTSSPGAGSTFTIHLDEHRPGPSRASGPGREDGAETPVVRSLRPPASPPA